MGAADVALVVGGEQITRDGEHFMKDGGLIAPTADQRESRGGRVRVRRRTDRRPG